MTTFVRTALAVLFALTSLALTAPSAAARIRHHRAHHHAGAQTSPRHRHHESEAAKAATKPAHRHHHRHHHHHRERETTAANRHAKAEVHRETRHAALCQTVMIHRKWVTHCRGEKQ